MEQRNNLVLQGTETFSRGQLDNVALESLPLVNYAAGKVNEQTVPFRFLPGDLKQLSAIGVTEALA